MWGQSTCFNLYKLQIKLILHIGKTQRSEIVGTDISEQKKVNWILFIKHMETSLQKAIPNSSMCTESMVSPCERHYEGNDEK